MVMHFHSLADFFHMGGYAAYVWPAYGIAAVILISQVISAVSALKAKRKKT